VSTIQHDSQLAEIIKSSGLPIAKAETLLAELTPLVAEAGRLMADAKSVNVTDVTQRDAMKEARRVRLGLKDVRVRAEKVRKALKAEYLAGGRAVDACGNWISDRTEPEEARLLACEEFEERAILAQREALRSTRHAELAKLGIDGGSYQLGTMPEAAFVELVENTRLAIAAREEAARKAEAERAELERQRVAEVQRLQEENRKQREEHERKEAELRAERAKVEAEERAKREAAEAVARKEREAREAVERDAAARAEAEKKRLASEARAAKKAAAAPDAQKMLALATDIESIPFPEFKTDDGKAFAERARSALKAFAAKIRTEAETIGGAV